MAQTRPDYGLRFEVRFLRTLCVVPSSLRSGVRHQPPPSDPPNLPPTPTSAKAVTVLSGLGKDSDSLIPKTQSPKTQNLNNQHQTTSIKHQKPNTKHKTPNIKYQISNRSGLSLATIFTTQVFIAMKRTTQAV